MFSTRRLLASALLLATSLCALAQQGPPAGPVKIVIGFAPGGPPDTTLRLIAAQLEKQWGRPVVVENQVGAAGTIAAAAVARAKPDGQTLLFGVAANMAVAPATLRPPPYDPSTAFSPIVEVARGPYLWLVRADAPATTMREFVQWAREQPGKLNYGSPGQGSQHHLATEMLKQSAGFFMVHVPYRSAAYQALLAGDIHGMFESMPAPQPYLQGGRLRALAVTGPRRLAALPDVPTLQEQGFDGMEVTSWWGFVGPAGLPETTVAALNADIRRALADPELRATLAKWSIEPSPDTPQAFGRHIAREYERWRRVVAQGGLRFE